MVLNEDRRELEEQRQDMEMVALVAAGLSSLFSVCGRQPDVVASTPERATVAVANGS